MGHINDFIVNKTSEFKYKDIDSVRIETLPELWKKCKDI